MSLKKGDFIEVEYTGKVKENQIIFDTTNEKIAKENEIYDNQMSYGPIIVCLGENHLIKGLDKNLEGKELNKEYDFEIPAEDAFGKKSSKLLRLVPKSTFNKHQIMPQVGLQVQIDGMNGLIKTVTGGRVIVDFNHPLASKDLVYNIKVNKVIEEPTEKIKAVLKLSLGLKDEHFKIEKKEAEFEIKLNEQFQLPGPMLGEITKKIEELTKQKVKFV